MAEKKKPAASEGSPKATPKAAKKATTKTKAAQKTKPKAATAKTTRKAAPKKSAPAKKTAPAAVNEPVQYSASRSQSAKGVSLQSLVKNRNAVIAAAVIAGLVVITLVIKLTQGGGLSGTYNCEGGIYQSLEFTSGNNVNLTSFGIKTAASYEINDGSIIISDAEGKSLIFTKEDGAISTNIPLFGKVVCRK